ncbi:MAG: HlyD family efflux transporter periplasmic adaptor subunit [Bacillota bacterium]
MKAKTKKKIYIAVVLIVIIAIVIAVVVANQPNEEEKYDTFTMETGTIQKVIVSSASVVAEDITTVYSPVNGTIKFQVEDGTIVKKDDVVAKIGAYSLKAPHDGEIMYILDEGDDVYAGYPTYKIIDFDGMVMQASVSELDINSISIGQEVEITLSASFENSYTGVVTSIDKEGLNYTGSTYYVVKTTLEGDGVDQVYLGMTGDINIEIGSVEDVVIAPISKISFSGSTAYVTLRDEEGTFYNQEIEVGFTDGVYIEIIGLPAGTVYYYETEDDVVVTPYMG